MVRNWYRLCSSLPFNRKIINRFVIQEEDLKVKYPFAGTTIWIVLDKLEDNFHNKIMMIDKKEP